MDRIDMGLWPGTALMQIEISVNSPLGGLQCTVGVSSLGLTQTVSSQQDQPGLVGWSSAVTFFFHTISVEDYA